MLQPGIAIAPKARTHSQLFPSGRERLIPISEVSHRTGYGKSTIWAKVASGEFPKPLKVKAGVSRWRESAIDGWIDEVIEANEGEAVPR